MNKETLKDAGYKYVKFLGNGQHVLDLDGHLEVWFSSELPIYAKAINGLLKNQKTSQMINLEFSAFHRPTYWLRLTAFLFILRVASLHPQ
jgi:hypothetical protein